MAGNINIEARRWFDGRLHIECEWPLSLVELDMAFWEDPRACEGRKMPGPTELSKTWNWSKSRVIRYLKKRSGVTPKRTKPVQRDTGAVQPTEEEPEEIETIEPERTEAVQGDTPPDQREPSLKGTPADPSPSPSPPPSPVESDSVATSNRDAPTDLDHAARRQARFEAWREAWVRRWKLRHLEEPTLGPSARPQLAECFKAFGGDLDAFDRGMAAFWAAVDRGHAWRGYVRGTVGLPEFTRDLEKWVSAGRALRAVEPDPEPPPSQPSSTSRPPPAATPDAAQAWEQLVEGFRERLGHQDSDIWVERPGHPVELDSGVLVVELANRHYATWWLDQGFPLIAEELGQPVRLLVDGVEPDLAEAS